MAQAAAVSKHAALQQQALLLQQHLQQQQQHAHQQQQHMAVGMNPQWVADMSSLPLSLLQQHQGPGLYNSHYLQGFNQHTQPDAMAHISLAAAYACQLEAASMHMGGGPGKMCAQQPQPVPYAHGLPPLQQQQQQLQQQQRLPSLGGSGSGGSAGAFESSTIPESQQSEFDTLMDAGQGGGSCSGGGSRLATDLYA